MSEVNKLNTENDPTEAISPFEFKDQLLRVAQSHADRMMLNAGRGNPNFLALAPRRAFLQLGEFALQEAERSYSYLNSGFGGLPQKKGMQQRFETFMHAHEDAQGMRFIQAAISLVQDQLGLDPEDFLVEMVQAFLGCQYPQPMAILEQFEPVIKAYLKQELYGSLHTTDDFSLFATEGGTAAMSYIFQSLKANRLIRPGDKIALGVPIFTPYLEIPELDDFQLQVVELEASEEGDWQLSEATIQQLRDPEIRLLCLVNPSNPPSVKMSSESVQAIRELVEKDRPDLMLVTDDVYATFADEFSSLFIHCPHNTLCVYSFSKYFGATGWRLGVIALHENNVFDKTLHALPESDRQALHARYAAINSHPEELPFLERMVADSRTVALHHSAGLSAPQQLQMTLFALMCLMDNEQNYKAGARRLIQSRYDQLYQAMGVDSQSDDNTVGYYTLLDLQVLSETLYGKAFSEWFMTRHNCSDFLFRLADETGIVLLPARGFEVHHPAVRVSLANLTLADYTRIGQFTRQLISEYFSEFQSLK